MECNFSQVQNYFKFSKYKGHPTIKITAPPTLPHPLHLFLIIKWYSHFRLLRWKREVNILLCTCTKHVSISHHLHSYERSLFIDLPLWLDKKRVEISYKTLRPLPSNSAQTLQPEASPLPTELTICFDIWQKKGLRTVRSSVGLSFNFSELVTFLPLLIDGNCVRKGK